MRSVNTSKVAAIGILILTGACLTTPGDLGAVGESSGGAEGSGGTSGSSGSPTTAGTVTTGVGSTTGVETTDAESSDGSESSTGEPVDPPVCGVGEGIARRLTNTQFEHAVADVFGVEIEGGLSSDGSGAPFEGGTEVSVEDSVAIQMAADSVAAAFDTGIACDADRTPRQCAEGIADQLGRLALRGQHDVDVLMAAYDSEDSFDAGLRAIVSALVVSSEFVVVTPTGEMEGANLRLDGVSLATRLSLFIWNTIPDDELLDAAEMLSDSEVLQSQVDRMLADPRYQSAQAQLYSQMTRVDELPQMDRSAVDDGWSAGLAEAMVEEQRRFVMSQAANSDATLESLMTSALTYVNPDLLSLYGDDVVAPPPPGGGWGPAGLDSERRGGLLTQLGFVARHSSNVPPENYQAPTSRGLGVTYAFGCVVVPPPPPDVLPGIGPINDREDWEQEVESPAECAGCHVVMDPPGHAFGNYDGIGRWSETSDSTVATAPLFDIEVADAVDLGAQLAVNEEVMRCITEQHYTFALRRWVNEDDDCAVDQYLEAFTDSGGNLRALVAAIATSTPFQLARP